MKKLGERLKWLRENVLRESLETLSARLTANKEVTEPSRGQLNRYELDRRPPRSDYILFLARETGAPVEWMLLGDDAAADAPKRIADRATLEEVARLVDEWRATQPEDAERAARAREAARKKASAKEHRTADPASDPGAEESDRLTG